MEPLNRTTQHNSRNYAHGIRLFTQCVVVILILHIGLVRIIHCKMSAHGYHLIIEMEFAAFVVRCKSFGTSSRRADADGHRPLFRRVLAMSRRDS